MLSKELIKFNISILKKEKRKLITAIESCENSKYLDKDSAIEIVNKHNKKIANIDKIIYSLENNNKSDKTIKFLTDNQFDELMEHLQGTRLTQAEGIKDCGFSGMKLTKGQMQFKNENYKRCRKCKTWIGISDECTC